MKVVDTVVGLIQRLRSGAEPPPKLPPWFPDPYRTTLQSMYDGEPQPGEDGQKHDLQQTVRITQGHGLWLYELCRKVKPRATLEIGMAYGFSTLYFLAAQRENGAGSHTSIDPFQFRPWWAGIGVGHAKRIDPDHFRFMEETSFRALVRLAQEGRQFEVIFVDGDHKFDSVLVDFTLSAEICPVGGHIILDDFWMTSIRRVVGFIRANRKDFVEVPAKIGHVAVFQRVAADERDWSHFVKFA